MVRDVPAKAHDSKDMHQIEDVLEIMETQKEVSRIQEIASSSDEEPDEITRTVATNTTK